MTIHEEITVPAPLQKVWNAINDPEIMRKCIPGVQDVKPLSDDLYSAKIKIKVGFLSAEFEDIRVRRMRVEPERSVQYELSGTDSHNLGAFTQTLAISLTPSGAESTKISVDANASLRGKFATLGRRLAAWKAKEIASEFASKLSSYLKES